MTTTTFNNDAFLTALSTRFEMDEEDANAISTIVSDLFWGEDEVNDEDLDKETRALFYNLQSEGILTFRRTEYKFEGATRRAFFWRLTEHALAGTVEETNMIKAVADEAAVLYDQLHADVWNRDAITA